jgi:hypothetical protein
VFGTRKVITYQFDANNDHWRMNLPILTNSHRVYTINYLGYGSLNKPDPLDLLAISLYVSETWAKQVNDFFLDLSLFYSTLLKILWH